MNRSVAAYCSATNKKIGHIKRTIDRIRSNICNKLFLYFYINALKIFSLNETINKHQGDNCK